MTTPPLVGKLVRLRAHEPGDEPLLYEWFNDQEVIQNLTVAYPLSHQQERDFIEQASAASFATAHFAMETLAEGQLIGNCSIVHTSPENRSGRIGIAIGDKSRWDRGYGTDAMQVLCRFGFEVMNLHRLELDVYAFNERARRVYEKVGFQLEARRREAIFRAGRYEDVLTMGLLEGELKRT